MQFIEEWRGWAWGYYGSGNHFIQLSAKVLKQKLKFPLFFELLLKDKLSFNNLFAPHLKWKTINLLWVWNSNSAKEIKSLFVFVKEMCDNYTFASMIRTQEMGQKLTIIGPSAPHRCKLLQLSQNQNNSTSSSVLDELLIPFHLQILTTFGVPLKFDSIQRCINDHNSLFIQDHHFSIQTFLFMDQCSASSLNFDWKLSFFPTYT